MKKSDANPIEHDLDVLFSAPLAEFTPTRNALAARLKREERREEAERVKALSKPPVSAWTVNQLYRTSREIFDRLIETGRAVREAQLSQFSGKTSDVRTALDRRREALSALAQAAEALLRKSGHNPTTDIMRRIGVTFEAISALPETPSLGRLTHDLDPPGFDLLASLMPGAGAVSPAKPVHDPKRAESQKVMLTDAKALLKDAESAQSEAQTKAREAEAALKDASAQAKRAEAVKHEAREKYEKASAASEEAAHRARDAARELEETQRALDDATRAVERASVKVQSLLS